MKVALIKDCPKCAHRGGCKDTRWLADGRIRRRYECLDAGCKHRWTTIEMLVGPSVKGGKIVSLFDDAQKKRYRKEVQDEMRHALQTVFGVLPAPLMASTGKGLPVVDVDIDAVHRRRAKA